MKKQKRILSPYEQTLLARAGLSHLTPEQIGDQPVEYIVGWVEFLGLGFKVNPHVLIPRIETEELVGLVQKTLQTKINKLKPNQKIVVADVGTGSGAIGLTLFNQVKQKGQDIQLLMSDISPKALQVARTNAQTLLPETNIEIFQSNLLSNFSQNQKIDVLIANLPYIPSEKILQLDPSVKDFEPQLALNGGRDGLQIIGRLLKQAPKYLSQNAVIWLEIDESHTSNQLSKLTPGFSVQIFPDQFNKPRFAKLTLKQSF